MDIEMQNLLNLTKGLKDSAEMNGNKTAFYHCEWIINKWGDGTTHNDRDIYRELGEVTSMLDLQKKYDEHRQYLKQLQETKK